MAELKELGYAWRDYSENFSEHDSLALAIEQVIQQVRGLPPGSSVYEPATIDYLGEIELDDKTQPNQQYLLRTTYAVPVE